MLDSESQSFDVHFVCCWDRVCLLWYMCLYYHIAVDELIICTCLCFENTSVLNIILIPIPRRLSIELVGLSQLRGKSAIAMSREWWTTGIIAWYHMIFLLLGSGYHDILISTKILHLSWLPFFKDESENTFLGPSDSLVHLHRQV